MSDTGFTLLTCGHITGQAAQVAVFHASVEIWVVRSQNQAACSQQWAYRMLARCTV